MCGVCEDEDVEEIAKEGQLYKVEDEEEAHDDQ